MHPDLFALLFSVIGVAWLTIVPTYRGWQGLNSALAEQVEATIAALRAAQSETPESASPSSTDDRPRLSRPWNGPGGF